MVISVGEALDGDTAEIITVTRTAPGAFVDGEYQAGIETTFKTLCSVQQPTGAELQKLPQGERNKDVRKFISKKQLRTTSDRDGVIADVVNYQAAQYRIIIEQNWGVYGHTTAFGARVG